MPVLEQAGLVTTQKIGRVRTCSLGLHRMEDEALWIIKYGRMLEQRIDQPGGFLERTKGTDR